jgi:hypothetical protein
MTSDPSSFAVWGGGHAVTHSAGFISQTTYPLEILNYIE